MSASIAARQRKQTRARHIAQQLAEDVRNAARLGQALWQYRLQRELDGTLECSDFLSELVESDDTGVLDYEIDASDHRVTFFLPDGTTCHLNTAIVLDAEPRARKHPKPEEEEEEDDEKDPERKPCNICGSGAFLDPDEACTFCHRERLEK